MGMLDKAKQMADKAMKHDKADEAVDKAADKADEATGGKYGDKVDKVQEMAKDQIEKERNE
jgi:hypothetical protein